MSILLRTSANPYDSHVSPPSSATESTASRAVRAMVACVACCSAVFISCFVLVLCPGAASADTTSGESFGDPLVISGSPTEREEAQAQEEARLSNPEAVAEREASQTSFENLDAEQAEKLARETFPSLVDEAAVASPQVPDGARITSYTSENTALLELADGKRAVIESSAPIATDSGANGLVPIDLSLAEASGSVLEPTTPAVELSIPKQLDDGVTLNESGVSLTPVDAEGGPLSTTGRVLAGSDVLYANALTDTDVVVKPTALGFNEDALVRSERSPQQLAYRVGLPQGASLDETSPGGPVEVVNAGATLATILPANAHDAAGTVVPVSMSVSGDTITVSVNGEGYQYPIAVDPTVIDNEKWGAWTFVTNNERGLARLE